MRATKRRRICFGVVGSPLCCIEQGTLEGLESAFEADDDDVRQCWLHSHKNLLAREEGQPGRALGVRHIGSLQIIAPRLLLVTVSGIWISWGAAWPWHSSSGRRARGARHCRMHSWSSQHHLRMRAHSNAFIPYHNPDLPTFFILFSRSFRISSFLYLYLP